MRIFLPIVVLCFSIGCLRAQGGHQLWLRNNSAAPVSVVSTGKSATISIAEQELKQSWHGKPGASVTLTIVSDNAIKGDGFRLGATSVQAKNDAGILYGVYELLRRQQTGKPIAEEVVNPSYEIRILNHWDNLNGTIEHGFGGLSIFWRRDNPFAVTDSNRLIWKEYARANASIGINGTVINNVNANALVLTPEYLKRVKAIADVLRPYGVKTYLAINFASPKTIGKLGTTDPLSDSVINWWTAKVKEIYSFVPDLGGFVVKANSEGQPGPQDYGRTHADGANMLADAVKPFGGIVMWRAFVYQPNEKDRAKQAYNEFMPLDGKFRDNVIIQVKNGPVDFQPREPFSPLFGAMKKTPVMPEFQVTQEYLGQSIHLVFLSTMWEECLQSDTYQAGKGSTVARCTDGSIYPQKHSAIAGVANIGLDTNWCGHDFAQANWYAFGRLAWNNKLKSEQIADEWIKLTFSPAATEKISAASNTAWNTNFLVPVKQMMLESREAAVNYMMPLGLHHQFSANDHYGPGAWWAPARTRSDWTPPYYNKAETAGIGFDRTKKGSDAVIQYHEPLASMFNDPHTCPENLLLWFHHVSWDFKMKSGRTLWQEMCYKYDKGVQQVRSFQKTWDKMENYTDSIRFKSVQRKLRFQEINAVLWKDGMLQYFQTFHKQPIPFDIERPVNNLDDIIANEFVRRRQR
ncbi:MAG: alpha-glucuronidase [Bacteroidota bacterium]